MKIKLFAICHLLFVLVACDSPTATSPISMLPSPTDTATSTATPTATPTVTPMPTVTSTSTIDPTPTHTHTPTPVPTTTLEWECWNDGPGSECRADPSLSLKQMTFVSDDEAWAVGDDGYIARWDGQHWTRVASPTDKPLNAIDFIAPDDGWIAGEGGQLLYWDGNAWSVVREYQSPEPGAGQFVLWYAIKFSGPDDGWLAGCTSSEGGVEVQAMHWNGLDWQEISTSSRIYLYCYTAIAALSPQDIWMVGGDVSGVIVHWNGGAWQETFTSTVSWPYAISAISPEIIWVAGQQSTRSGKVGEVLYWDKDKWVDAGFPPAGHANSVLMVSENDGWVGGNALFHWNGNGWEKTDKLNPEWGKVIDIEASPNGEVWTLTKHATFLHLKAANQEGVK